MKNCYISLIFFFFIKEGAQASPGNYISTQSAMQQFARKLTGKNFIIFPEAREFPVQWPDSLKPGWIKNDYNIKPYLLHAQPGENFVFQIGIWSINSEMKNVQIQFSDLKNEGIEIISSKEITCFNRGGINYQGHPFTKQISIPSRQVQALWMGINLPASAKGKYGSAVAITNKSVSRIIKIQLEVSGKVLADHGFDEGRRLSRLA